MKLFSSSKKTDKPPLASAAAPPAAPSSPSSAHRGAADGQAAGAADGEDAGQRGMLCVTVADALDLPALSDQANLFCVVQFDNTQAQTALCSGPQYTWDAPFKFDVSETLAGKSDASKCLQIWLYQRKKAGAGKDTTIIGKGVVQPRLAPDALARHTVTLHETSPAALPTAKINISVQYKTTTAGMRMSIDDFDIIKVIGKGSFGKVIVARKKDSDTIYAIKILKKSHLSQRGEIAHTIAERKILARNTNPYLVSLKYSFQNDEKVYFVLDYINGGELFVHLQRETHFEEPRACLYAAMLVCALEHLHNYNIIYRDIKPENILIDRNGFIKLTDFGLCKEEQRPDGRTSTFCGTPEYMAPEILMQKAYGQEVDWWTIGTLVYEMIVGLPPFYDENVQEMYQRILYMPLVFPPGEMSLEAQSFVTRMLNRDPSKRLGFNGVHEIKEHRFFRSINWDDLAAGNVLPMWKPPVAGDDDTTNFDEAFTSMVAEDSVATPGAVAASVQKQFANFTYYSGSLTHQEI